MLGKYSLEGIKGATTSRTTKVVEIIQAQGGKVAGMYALIGTYDLAFMVDLPSNASLIKASTDITKLTGIAFSSLPAISVEEFDKIIG